MSEAAARSGLLVGESCLGIELGSTRIKACLIDPDDATELETVVCIHESLHSQLREGTAGMDNNGYHSVQIRQNLRQLAFQIRVAAEGWIDGKTQLFVLLRLRGVRGEVQRQMATGDARWRMIDDAEKRSRI